jgi:hypothetical protein
LQLLLLSFSTGGPHPLAEQPVIFLATKSLPLGNPTVLIEVVGDFVILMVDFLEEWNENENMFFLVRWKKGEAHCVSVSNSYHIPSNFADASCFSFVLPKGEPT